MGSRIATLLACACAVATPVVAQAGSGAARDTIPVAGSAVGVAVQRGGGGVSFDPTAPRPVRRMDGDAPRAVLPPAVVQRAPFPIRDAPDLEVGTVAEDPGSPRVGDRIRIEVSRAVAPGTRLQLWRPGPTGATGPMGQPVAGATVLAVAGSVATAQVNALFDGIRAGDALRPHPEEPDLAGRRLEAVSSGRRALLLGSVPERPLVQLGDWMVVDVGSDASLNPGDEFVPVGGPADLRGETRLQVVSVHPDRSVVRVLSVGSFPLASGVTVRLDQRVR